VQADYSIAELCALAQILLWKFGHSKMAQALQAGRDLHLDVGATLLGIEYDEAIQRKKDPDVKNARQLAKILNFGVPGGFTRRLADFAKSYGVEMSGDEAMALRDRWLHAYPEMAGYFQEVQDRVRQSPDGRFLMVQARSNRKRGNVGYTDGCNSPFQGLAADFALDAMYHASRACYIDKLSPLHGSNVVAFVHDELILECLEENAHECAVELKAIMERRAREWLPDIPIQAEPCIMRVWSKDAEAVWEGDRLVPWEPN